MSTESRHPLGGLLVSQFFGAFNDNAWKIIVIELAVAAVLANPVDGTDLAAATLFQTNLAFLVLVIPLMVFSLPAGVLCDRVSKRTVIICMKGLEVLLMAAATAVLFFAPGNPALPLAILAFMGLQSALFGPAKYGILPEIVPHPRLSAANGLLELWTFVAIISGTAVAGYLLGWTADLGEGGRLIWLTPLALGLLSLIGLVASRSIPKVPPARAEGGLVTTVTTAWQAMRADRVLWLATLGSCFYWSVASLVGAVIIVFGRLELGLEHAGTLLALFGLGVGVGGMLAGRLSADKVEYGLIPLGAVGLALFILVLGLLPPTLTATLILLLLLGISSGFIVVPLNSLIQWRSPDDRRGAVIALSRVLVFGGMIVGTLAGLVMSESLALPTRGMLISCGLVTASGTLWALRTLPDAFLRLVLVFLTQTFYRLRVIGARHVPSAGGALLVPNHMSFVDGLFLFASIDRPIRFVVDSSYFRHPIYGPFLRSLGSIEISSSGGPRVILRAMRDAGRFLDEGAIVCIFAEGEVSRTGSLLPFRRGAERIAKGRDAPIIPVNLDRVWGSIFSRERGRFVTKLPRRIPYPVTVAFGEPLPPTTSIEVIRRQVQELGTTAWEARRSTREPLHISFIRAVRRRPLHFLFADPLQAGATGFRVLVDAISLARRLNRHWQEQQHVGIALPPGVASAGANLAASLAGKTSLNLNYTSGRAEMETAIRQAGLQTVVTSRRFLEMAEIELPTHVVPLWIDEIAATTRWTARAVALLMGALLPARWLERLLSGRIISVDEVVAVILSSGGTGEPRLVQLTHFNIDSNVEAVAQVLRVSDDDRLLGTLPHFHPLGYMTLWFSATQGVASLFQPNPLDAAEIGERIQQYKISLLIATPTFLRLYLRRCTPAQFGSLRMVLTGVEKLTEGAAQAFEDHFGIRPLECYGAAECSPGITASTLDFRAPGFYQPGSRRGSVGQPLPGVTVRIVDPDDLETELAVGTPGMLTVMGPNIMRGYLGRDDLTGQVLRDGWYITGDIGVVDEDGFVSIIEREIGRVADPVGASAT